MNQGKINKIQPLNNYTKFSNDLLKSNELLLNEKALLFFLLSHPEKWVINKQYLYNSLPDSKGSIDNAFKGLSEKGFIISTKIINEKGQFKGWYHEVHPHRVINIPKSEKPKVGKTEIGEPENGKNPPSENAPYIKIEDIKINSSNNILDNNILSIKAKEKFSLLQCQEIFNHHGQIDQAELFHAHYNSVDWMTNGQEIKNLGSLIQKWLLNNKIKSNANQRPLITGSTRVEQYKQSGIDYLRTIGELDNLQGS
jgi:hypothetical protein